MNRDGRIEFLEEQLKELSGIYPNNPEEARALYEIKQDIMKELSGYKK